ncbi:hypothetical protein Tco_1357724 [Tanacetum coccineum]
MAIQAGWGKGLSVGQTDEEIIAILKDIEGFDAYSDRKLYPLYDKLFEVKYPFVARIANGYRHSLANLLKVHPDPALVGGSFAPTISTALVDPVVPSSKKKT